MYENAKKKNGYREFDHWSTLIEEKFYEEWNGVKQKMLESILLQFGPQLRNVTLSGESPWPESVELLDTESRLDTSSQAGNAAINVWITRTTMVTVSI